MLRVIVMLSVFVLFATHVFAGQPNDMPILVIGASYENGKTPISDNLEAPFGGISVGLGNYLALGDALARTNLPNGLVINKAQAGATSNN